MDKFCTGLLATALLFFGSFAVQAEEALQTLDYTDQISVFDVVETGPDSYVIVLATLEEQGHRMGAFIECNSQGPKITFQLGFYPSDGKTTVHLWTAPPAGERSYWGRPELGNSRTGFFSPIVIRESAKTIILDILRPNASFGNSAGVKIMVPAEPDFTSAIAQMSCLN